MNTATFAAAIDAAPRRSAALTVFVIGLVAWSLTNMDQSLFGYALPGILTEFQRGPETAGLILSISFVAAALMVVVAGMAADRYGRGVVMVVLLGGSAVFVGLLGWTATLSALIVLRVFGFGLSAGLSPVLNAMVIENAPARLRAMAMGLLQCGYPLGWFIASLLAAPLLARSGWRTACLAAFIVVPIALFMGYLLRRHPPAPVAKPQAVGGRGAGLRTLLQPRYRVHFWASFATFFLFGGAYAGSAFFFPTFFTSVRGYSESDAALLVGLSNGVAIFGYLSAAALGEYVISRRNVFALWCLLGAAALLILLWSTGGRTADYVWFAVMAIFFYGAMAVLPLLVAEIFPPELRATALGACASAPLSLGFALFPLIVPAVIGHLGWVWALTIVVAPALALAALTALLLPSLKSATLRGA
jgi:SHS family lactate transporter-like MFS transporter